MLRCNQVTQLTASDDVRTAPLWTRVTVRFHLMMCRSCRRYVQELAAIGDAVRALARDAREDSGRVDELVQRVLSSPSGFEL